MAAPQDRAPVAAAHSEPDFVVSYWSMLMSVNVEISVRAQYSTGSCCGATAEQDSGACCG